MDPTRQHDSGAPYRRPTMLVGSRGSACGRMSVTPDQAIEAGMYGLDLDLRRAWSAPSIDNVRLQPTARIKSVWLPMQYAGPFSEQRAGRLRDFLNLCATRRDLKTIVLPRNTPVRHQGISLGRMAQQLADWYGLRIAVSIPADHLIQQSGSHLERVANMRRIAEEWDLDMALDLTASGIDQWEAEAALMRLFPRLTLVRLRPWLDGDGMPLSASPARICMRSASMLADQAYSGAISIETSRTLIGSFSMSLRSGLHEVTMSRADVLAHYDRVQQLETNRRFHVPGSGPIF
ncbi:MAG: hypothetical protein M3412_09800 [Chloroflexota bacterium]|nr:hypothetical protein [Chloroflexota bacterium]